MIVCGVCKHPHILSFDEAVTTKDGKTWVSKGCYDPDKDLTVPDDLDMPELDNGVPGESK